MEAAKERRVIGSLEREFTALHIQCCALIRATSEETLYRPPNQPNDRHLSSVGEYVLQGAAAVEQTFGGITANLWDDPFEWTLPEYLATPALVIEYLEEVEATRRRGFVSFARDVDLLKEIMMPAGEARALIDLLIETLVKAAEYYRRAAVTLSLFTEAIVSEQIK